MDPAIEHAVSEIREIGYAIVPNLISEQRIYQAQQDAEELLEPTPILMPGLDGKIRGRMCKGLFVKSRAFDDMMCNPTILAIVREVLAPQDSLARNLRGGGIRLTGTMIKDVQPREKHRHFHRDDGFFHLKHPHPTAVVNTLWAIDPFCVETGATWVVPESHKRSGPVDQECRYDTVTMVQGSVLLIDGALWHNNGSNTTYDTPRKALNCYYNCSWFEREEDHYMGLAVEKLSELPPALRDIV